MPQIPMSSVVAALTVLAVVTFTIVAVLRLEKPWLQPWALARAIAQLGALTIVLNIVIERTEYVLLFLVVMVGAAAVMVAQRLQWRWPQALLGALVIAVSASVPGLVVFGTGAVAFESNYLLAVGGIVVGGVMTISTLFGRTLTAELKAQRDQVEAWLALGATPRQAAQGPVRAAGSLALLPSTDQTRVTGIVTLPGAFVGAVFAGLPVLEAAVFQIVVLASLLCAGAISLGLWTLTLGAPRHLPK